MQNSPTIPEAPRGVEELPPHEANLLAYDERVRQNGLMESVKKGVDTAWESTKDIAQESVRFLKENKDTLMKGAGIALVLYGIKKVADGIFGGSEKSDSKEGLFGWIKKMLGIGALGGGLAVSADIIMDLMSGNFESNSIAKWINENVLKHGKEKVRTFLEDKIGKEKTEELLGVVDKFMNPINTAGKSMGIEDTDGDGEVGAGEIVSAGMEEVGEGAKWLNDRVNTVLYGLGFTSRGANATKFTLGVLLLKYGKTALYLSVPMGAFVAIFQSIQLITSTFSESRESGESLLSKAIDKAQETYADIEKYRGNIMEFFKNPEKSQKAIAKWREENGDNLILNSVIKSENFIGDFVAEFGDGAMDLIASISDENTKAKNLQTYLESCGKEEKEFSVKEFIEVFKKDDGGILFSEDENGNIVSNFFMKGVKADIALVKLAWSPLTKAGGKLILNPSLEGLGDAIKTYTIGASVFVGIGAVGGALGLIKGGMIGGGIKGAKLPVSIIKGHWNAGKMAAKVVASPKATIDVVKHGISHRYYKTKGKVYEKLPGNFLVKNEIKAWEDAHGQLGKQRDAMKKQAFSKNARTKKGEQIRQSEEFIDSKEKGYGHDNKKTPNSEKIKPDEIASNSAREVENKNPKKTVESLTKQSEQEFKNLQKAVQGGDKGAIETARKAFDTTQEELIKSIKKIPRPSLKNLKLGGMAKMSVKGGVAVLLIVESARIIKFLKEGKAEKAGGIAAEFGKDICPVWGSIRDTNRSIDAFKNGETGKGLESAGWATLGWVSDALIGASVVSFGLTGVAGSWMRGGITAGKAARIAKTIRNSKKLAKATKVVAGASLTMTGLALSEAVWQNCEKTEVALR